MKPADIRSSRLSQEFASYAWLGLQDELLQTFGELEVDETRWLVGSWRYAEEITNSVSHFVAALDFSSVEKTRQILESIACTSQVPDQFQYSELLLPKNFSVLMQSLKSCLVDRSISIDRMFEIIWDKDDNPLSFLNCDQCGDMCELGICGTWGDDIDFHGKVLKGVSTWGLDQRSRSVTLDLLYGIHTLVTVLKEATPERLRYRNPYATYEQLQHREQAEATVQTGPKD